MSEFFLLLHIFFSIFQVNSWKKIYSILAMRMQLLTKHWKVVSKSWIRKNIPKLQPLPITFCQIFTYRMTQIPSALNSHLDKIHLNLKGIWFELKKIWPSKSGFKSIQTALICLEMVVTGHFCQSQILVISV